MNDAKRLERFSLYLRWRLAAYAGLLLSSLLSENRFLVWLSLAILLWGVASVLWLRSASRVSISVQLTFDLLLSAVLIHESGGTLQNFTLLYLLLIISGGWIAPPFANRFAAAGATLLFLGQVAVEVVGDPSYGLRLDSTTSLRLLGTLLSFHAVSLLLSLLDRQERKLRDRLAATERQNLELEALNHVIVESIGSGIILCSKSGAIQFINPAAAAILDEAASTLRKRSILEIIPEITEFVKPSPEGMLSFDRVREVEAKLGRCEVTYAGRFGRKHLGFSVSEIRSLSLFLIVFQDLTAYRTLEEGLKRSDRLAAVGKLSAGIAHEIRNPLASISGAIELLRHELTLDSANERLMEIVLREISRLNTLITDFLTFARPMEISLNPVDFSKMMQETLTLFQRSRELGDSVQLKSEIRPDLHVNVDSKQIRQVVWNLVKNGLQAMPEGGTLTIRADWADQKQDRLRLEVSDTGLGIPESAREKIFDPFFTTKGNGSGLGLAVVYQVVQSHKGTIRVSSEEGKGTTFSIELPRTIGEIAGNEAAQAASR